MSRTLEEGAYEQLEDASRGIGQQLLDRLLIADRELAYLAATAAGEASRGGAADAAGSRHDLVIASAQHVDADGARLLLGEPFALPAVEPTDPRRSRLFVRGESPHEVLIARPAPGGLLVGRVDTGYLWSASDLLPYAMEVCVIESFSRAMLFCSKPLSSEGARIARSALAEHSDSRLEWSGTDGDVLAVHWELFLPSRFAATPWSIVVTQPADVALASLNAFNEMFPTVILASLILITLLALSQIRRTLTPLQRLLAGTRDIAAQRFSTRVEFDGRDEFSELGTALNAMAESLGAQFETMTALAEIDRLILSAQPIEKVVEHALDRLARVTPDWCLSVLLLDAGRPQHGHLYSRVPGVAAPDSPHRVTVSAHALGWLARVSAGSIANPDWVRQHVSDLPTLPGAETMLCVPIFRGEDVRGALVAQLRRASAATDDARTRLGEFASRLAVAIAAADHEKELFDRAHFDPLTGLPNRQLCYDRLHQAIAQARRDRHHLAVLFIDLDNFKTVNDSLGHSHGDDLLRETALRLIVAVRDTDTVARLGGDEYVVILPHVQGVAEIDSIVEKMLGSLSRPFRIDGRDSNVTASIGVTVFPEDGQTAEELLRKADTAMYAAKSGGRARSAAFREEMDLRVRERFALQEDLRHALGRNEFSLVYQPEFELRSGRLLCAETLLRWRHSERGMVPPSTFVPVLEEMGLIEEVGRWVIETALAEYAGWRARGLDLPRISINVSGRQLAESDLVDFVMGRLRAHGLGGHNLELELTEHSLIADFSDANEILDRLHAQGIRVAIDDFGTGYSSLGYLQRLRFDVLKIDRAFVSGVPAAKSVAIVQAIVAVARALEKEVVAEGVETQAQRGKLVELGCDIGQGFLFSLPISGDELVGWARHANREALPATAAGSP